MSLEELVGTPGVKPGRSFLGEEVVQPKLNVFILPDR